LHIQRSKKRANDSIFYQTTSVELYTELVICVLILELCTKYREWKLSPTRGVTLAWCLVVVWYTLRPKVVTSNDFFSCLLLSIWLLYYFVVPAKYMSIFMAAIDLEYMGLTKNDTYFHLGKEKHYKLEIIICI
jgi:hypothetical protein